MSDDKMMATRDVIELDEWAPRLSRKELDAKYGPGWISFDEIHVVRETDEKFMEQEAAGLAHVSTRRFPNSSFIWRAAYKEALRCLTKESGNPFEAAARAARAAYMNRKRHKAAPSKTQKQGPQSTPPHDRPRAIGLSLLRNCRPYPRRSRAHLDP